MEDWVQVIQVILWTPLGAKLRPVKCLAAKQAPGFFNWTLQNVQFQGSKSLVPKRLGLV